MTKLKNIFLLVTASGFLCFSNAALSVDLQSAVDDVCECNKEPFKLMEKAMAQLQEVQASGDYSNVMEAQSEMMGAIDAGSNCFESLPEKYPDIDANKELQNKVMAMAEEQCPNPAKKMVVK